MEAATAAAAPDTRIELTTARIKRFCVWYDDPLAYFEEALQAKNIRKWQRSLLVEIRDRRKAGELHTRVHVRTNHGSGKTWLAGGLVNWWQTTRPNSRTFTTAPTWDLLSTRLWVEIRKHFQNATPDVRLGELMPRSAMWYTGGISNPDWFAMGSSSDRPQNLEGLHSWAMARVIDEAKAVPDDVYTATDGMFFGSEESFDMWISTPATRNGRFYRRDLDGGPDLIRKVVTIDDLIADGLPGSVEGKKRFIEDYGGEESFEYRSRAMAEYIEDSGGALVPFSWIERAMLTDDERKAKGLEAWHVAAGAPTVGYDVAGSVDGDENATAPVYGPDSNGRFEITDIDHWHERDTMVSRDRVIETANRIPARCVRVDIQGLGKGVGDAITEKRGERGLKFFVEEYRSADPARDPGRFLNRKAENGWTFRMAMEADKIRLPKHATLREQIAAEKYEVRNGKIRVIDNPKDSPDWFDAVLMGIGEPIVVFTAADIGGGGDNSRWNWQMPAMQWSLPGG